MKHQRRGTILIITIGVLLVLSSMVLVFARTMRVEAMASANAASSIQAASIERAAEQYAIAQITNQPTGVPEDVFTMDDTNWAGLQVGDGYFWIIRPDYGDQQFSQFGLVDEGAKLNLNSNLPNMSDTDKSAMFAMLPGMTQDQADAIMDWQDADENITGNGAESNYYMSLPSPYMAKNDTFESVEELLLVKGFTRQLLYGLQAVDSGANPNAGVTQNSITSGALGAQSQTTASMMTDDQAARGIYDLLTVWSNGRASVPNNGRTITQAVRGLINVNRAPQEVLECLPGLTDADVQAIMAARTSASSSTDISWVQQAIPANSTIRSWFTGNTYQFSAEIVAVSGDGRAFKRARIVIDLGATGQNPPKIVFRRDLTDSGWPLAPEILDSLRSGQGLPAIAYTSPVRRTM